MIELLAAINQETQISTFRSWYTKAHRCTPHFHVEALNYHVIEWCAINRVVTETRDSHLNRCPGKAIIKPETTVIKSQNLQIGWEAVSINWQLLTRLHKSPAKSYKAALPQTRNTREKKSSSKVFFFEVNEKSVLKLIYLPELNSFLLGIFFV